MRGRMKEAVAAYEAALLRLPEDVRLLNRIGWILATTSDERLRDSSRARQLAERAVGLTASLDATSLDTLGAALACLGDFEGALRQTTLAISVARANQDAELLRDLEFRLGLYSRRQPFREP
jgi:tetratricopeptide (TPR) repeat protein